MPAWVTTWDWSTNCKQGATVLQLIACWGHRIHTHASADGCIYVVNPTIRQLLAPSTILHAITKQSCLPWGQVNLQQPCPQRFGLHLPNRSHVVLWIVLLLLQEKRLTCLDVVQQFICHDTNAQPRVQKTTTLRVTTNTLEVCGCSGNIVLCIMHDTNVQAVFKTWQKLTSRHGKHVSLQCLLQYNILKCHPKWWQLCMSVPHCSTHAHDFVRFIPAPTLFPVTDQNWI